MESPPEPRVVEQAPAEAPPLRAVLPAVMGHRVIPSFTAAAREIRADEIVRRVGAAVAAPDGWKPEPVEVQEGFLAGLMRRLRREPARAGAGA